MSKKCFFPILKIWIFLVKNGQKSPTNKIFDQNTHDLDFRTFFYHLDPPKKVFVCLFLKALDLMNLLVPLWLSSDKNWLNMSKSHKTSISAILIDCWVIIHYRVNLVIRPGAVPCSLACRFVLFLVNHEGKHILIIFWWSRKYFDASAW